MLRQGRVLNIQWAKALGLGRAEELSIRCGERGVLLQGTLEAEADGGGEMDGVGGRIRLTRAGQLQKITRRAACCGKAKGVGHGDVEGTGAQGQGDPGEGAA